MRLKRGTRYIVNVEGTDPLGMIQFPVISPFIHFHPSYRLRIYAAKKMGT